MTDSASQFEKLGGETVLRAIIDDFIDRVFADAMIGFFFASADRARIKAREYEVAARFLGAQVPYQGQPLNAAHSPHAIRGGHFMRRLRILEETLRDHGVPDALRAEWLSHNESLRNSITPDAGGECVESAAAPAEDIAQKRTPTPAEINAYLEESAKRTKRRLSLVGTPSSGSGEGSGAARALPVVTKKK